MQRLKSVTLAPVAAVANGISTSQKPAAGGAQSLTITGSLAAGGVATMDLARRVAIASSADDSGRTFTITGTDRRGNAQTETITGPNTATVTSLKDFKTVTAVSVDDNTAGNITVGTNGKISTQWLPVDRLGVRSLGIGVRQSGVATWTIEHAMQSPFTAGVGVLPPGGIANPPYLTPYPHPVLQDKTVGDYGAYDGAAITAVRLTITAFTAGASLTADFAPGFVGGGY